MRRRFFAVVPVVVLCSAAAVALAAGPGGSAKANRAAARADAVKLLGRLQLPPGATESQTEPAGDGGMLRRPFSSQPTSNLVDLHQWWIVSGSSPGQVLTYVKAHAPRDGRRNMAGKVVSVPDGNAGHTELVAVGFGFPEKPGVLSIRELVITARRLTDGKTGLRVDAQDIWIIPRPASERIPTQETQLRVTVTRFEHRLQGPLTFTSSRRLEHVITLLNSLPRGQPGVRNCPGDPGRLIRLVFTGPGGRAVAIFDPGGCGSVALTLHGKPQPTLATWPIPGHPHAELEQLLQRDLGLKFARY